MGSALDSPVGRPAKHKYGLNIAGRIPPHADMLRTDDLIGRLSVPLRSLDLTPGGGCPQ